MRESPAATRQACASCRHFLDDAEGFERALPGILILSSGGGSARGDQGLCRIHRQMLDPRMSCSLHAPASRIAR